MSDTESPSSGAIAIIGLSGRFPAAPNADALWENLLDGRESISRFGEAELLASGVEPQTIRNPAYVPAAAVLDGIPEFDAEFFHMTAREAECTDPQHRVLLECAWEALESAGHIGTGFPGRVGVYVGAGASAYWAKHLAATPEVLASVPELQITIGNSKDYVATRVSYKLNLNGPSLTVSTACSTSLVAVHLACQSLLDFHCDIALAGGVSIPLPVHQGYLYYEGGICSPDGHCRPFDEGAGGTVGGSGAGVVALRRLEDAISDGDTIHAVILGSAVNNDGSDKIGFTAPSERGQASVIAEALNISGISPESISYIEAHGTGTPLGDPIEIAALTRVFRRSTQRRQFCALGSIKSNFGHLDEAAGIAGLIKTVLALRHRALPASLNFKRPNPKLNLETSPFYVNDRRREWVAEAPRRAGVSSFGIGGTNAHVVLEEAAPQASAPSSRPASLLVISACTRTALDMTCRNLADHLERHPEMSLADVGFTLATGRLGFEQRRTLVCHSHADATEQLRSSSADVQVVPADEPAPRALFLFPGQGSQYPGMSAKLYRSEPVFRQALDECAFFLKKCSGFDLSATLFSRGGTDANGLDETELAQPCLFSVEYAIASLLRSWGIEPHAMIGHSLGEYVAATLAGVFTLEDCLILVTARGRLMQATPRGAMIAVPLPDVKLTPYVNGELTIAAMNAPGLNVLAGSVTAIEAAQAQFAANGVAAVRLRTSHAFHSPLVEPILGEFRALVRKTRLREPRIQFLSNVTGDWINPAQVTDPDYWVRHLRAPVRFSQGVEKLLTISGAVWIEAGPGRTLATLVQRHPDCPGGSRVLPTLSSAKRDEYQVLLSTLGELWARGTTVNWDAFFRSERRRRVPLPTYPFERQRYWIDAPRQTPEPEAAPVIEETSHLSIAEWFYVPRWTRVAELAVSQGAAPAGWVIFADQHGLADAAADLVRQVGGKAIVVRDGNAFAKLSAQEFLCPLHDAAAQERLWREFDEPFRSGSHILCLWPVQPRRDSWIAPNDPSHKTLLRLLALVQGFGSFSTARRLTVITSNTQSVRGEEVIAAESAALWGAVRVVAKEYPNIHCRMIDLDWGEIENSSDTATSLLAALSTPGSEGLAIRDGALWKWGLEPMPLASAGASLLREGGTYLITGGLGSMGLAFAEYLARTVRARLLLLSRSGLGDGSAGRPRFALLADTASVEEIAAAARGAVETTPLTEYPGLEPLLNAYCSALIWRFLSHGFDSTDRGTRVGLHTLVARQGILPKFQTFLEVMLRSLVEDGMVRRHADEIELLKSDFISVEELAGDIATRFPRFVPLAELVRHCVESYPGALSGKFPAVTVLYPDGTSEWLDAVMDRLPNYSCDAIWLRVAADLITRMIASSCDPVRVLEVGGGTGELTSGLAELIVSGAVEYHFTDISPTFLARARERAQERGLRDMRFAPLDISRPAESQGFELNSFDLVLGYNVVHATPDLVKTLCNLHALLRGGGALALVETVRLPRWIDLIWGLSDGWWSFTDRFRRRLSPIVTLEEWERVLSESGFVRPACYPRDARARFSDDAGLIVAEVPSDRSERRRSERDRRIRERIAAMEACGAEVCVVAADISQAGEAVRAIEMAEARFGPIHGIIHCAGVLGQTLLHEQSAAEVRRVLAPKVDGTLHLAAALGERPLDLFLLCSSMSAIDPIPGQFDYSAANAFLDGFAHARAARCQGLTVSLNWGFWQELGMIDTARVTNAVKQATLDEIQARGWSEKGVEVFARIMQGGVPPQLLVTPHPPPGVPQGSGLDHPILRECFHHDARRAIFSGKVEAGRAWYVDEHHVSGQVVLPGTSYLDLVVAAFCHAHGRGPVELRDVCFLVPMIFGDGVPTREVRLILEGEPSGSRFRILSQISSGRWQEHARGEIRRCSAEIRREQIDLRMIEARLAESSPAPDGFWARVNGFAPHWRNVTQAFFGTNEAMARCELPRDLRGDLSRFFLHPALLDTAMGFMAFRNEFDEFVPFSFRRLYVFGTLPARSASVFHGGSGNGSGAPVFCGSVLDVDGMEIVRVEDFTLRRRMATSTSPERLAEAENVRLEIDVQGDLNTLTYRPVPRRAPQDGEIEIEVRAAGLNFIEVLYALGMLPEFAGGRFSFGQECSGIITRVGEDVRGFKPGDEVIAYGTSCLSMFATLGATSVALKPASLSFEQAAALPAAFLTAWHALMNLARLQPGERVLIHAAAGGVGVAAVRIAQWRGAEIFATAGSPEKRQFLTGIGVPHVMDSRSLRFVDKVRQITGGEGVDVVLNSLSGEFIARSLSLLRRHGRFLELGKRDILRDTPLGMASFANFIAFFAVDVGLDLPEFPAIWRELGAHLQAGSFGPVPCTTFAATEVRAAFEHMAQARHIGKIVFSLASPESLLLSASAAPAGLPWEAITGFGETEVLQTEPVSSAAGFSAAELARHERPSLQSEFRPPESVTQKTLGAIWESLLGVAPIGVEDDFFELKGDSLLAAQVMSRLHQAFEVKLPLSLIFDYPTIRALAAQIDDRAGSADTQTSPYEEGVI